MKTLVCVAADALIDDCVLDLLAPGAEAHFNLDIAESLDAPTMANPIVTWSWDMHTKKAVRDQAIDDIMGMYQVCYKRGWMHAAAILMAEVHYRTQGHYPEGYRDMVEFYNREPDCRYLHIYW
jgi:hypothetical protein